MFGRKLILNVVLVNAHVHEHDLGCGQRPRQAIRFWGPMHRITVVAQAMKNVRT